MHPYDIPEVLNIERASFTTPWSEASFFSEIQSKNSIAKIAELNGVVVAYICIKHIEDECHILNLAVHPDYRRCGIAKALLSNIIQELSEEECKFFYLEVRASNYAARRLYEKFGFKTVGIRKRYYINPTEDAVIMMRMI